MAITLTINDQVASETFRVLMSPVVSSPIINEQDVLDMDGNISTYYVATKQYITFQLGYMTAGQYAVLKGFLDRQYELKKYPNITVSGAGNLPITNMVGKITLASQNIIDNCGTVGDVAITFRESKQI